MGPLLRTSVTTNNDEACGRGEGWGAHAPSRAVAGALAGNRAGACIERAASAQEAALLRELGHEGLKAEAPVCLTAFIKFGHHPKNSC